MGSSVKGATVLAGYSEGVIDLNNNTIVDTPLRFQGSESISSVFNRSGSVAVNDITALERSSNVYMARLAMRMGGIWNYSPNQSLPIDYHDVLNRQRQFFHQFGLGSETGIDLPSEATGQVGNPNNPGQALFFSFGQYDTYTTLQLAQYVATIANGGTRIAPRLVSEIRGTDPETGGVGPLKTEIEPKIMNVVDVDEEAMNRVQQGFYQVNNGSQGTARGTFANAPYSSAGKTGTAQAQYWDDEQQRITDPNVINSTYVGYAPFENPEIAVAVVVPYLPQGHSNSENQRAARRVMDAYFGVGEFESTATSDEDSEGSIQDLENLNEAEEEEE
jgi:cell division protein FtsI/penicillin-binding protein 2